MPQKRVNLEFLHFLRVFLKLGEITGHFTSRRSAFVADQRILCRKALLTKAEKLDCGLNFPAARRCGRTTYIHAELIITPTLVRHEPCGQWVESLMDLRHSRQSKDQIDTSNRLLLEIRWAAKRIASWLGGQQLQSKLTVAARAPGRAKYHFSPKVPKITENRVIKMQYLPFLEPNSLNVHFFLPSGMRDPGLPG